MRTTTMQMQMPISCGVCHTTTANDLVRLGELGVVCHDCLSDAYLATAALRECATSHPHRASRCTRPGRSRCI
jgi:hypothetical protein